MPFSAFDSAAMQRAIELARRGEGSVEPNPLVGAVVAAADGDPRLVGEGWHRRFGGLHAEVEALALAGDRARGGTLYVTLEPCGHHGKTPPCTEAIIAAGIARVVAAVGDPHPLVAGKGLARLAAAGITVDVGLEEMAAMRLTSPYRSLLTRGRPWVIAKWAAGTAGGLESPPGRRWLSSETSRERVHSLRGRVDAIVIGSGTALTDDPLLTPRPSGPRIPLRVVIDGRGRLSRDARLVRTAREVPLLVATGPAADPAWTDGLRADGAEVWIGPAGDPAQRLHALWAELGRRRCTNVLLEGGPLLLRAAFAAGGIDEAWVFITDGPTATADPAAAISDVPGLAIETVDLLGGDILVRGRIAPVER
jgi:diaminohydroxyphosphoribosylaminopyrimidine deaminase/5-amino-6-(5-phosphoribosylamino)uracil reductase